MFYNNYLIENQYITEVFKSEEEIKEAQKKIKDVNRDFWPWCAVFLKTLIYCGGVYNGTLTSTLISTVNPMAGLIGYCITIIGAFLIPMCTKWIRTPNTPDDQLARCDKFIRECEKTLEKIDDKKLKASLKKAIADVEKERIDIIKKLPVATQGLPKYKKYFK